MDIESAKRRISRAMAARMVQNDSEIEQPRKSGLPDLTSIQNTNVDSNQIQSSEQKNQLSLPVPSLPIVVQEDPIQKRKIILMIQRYILEFDQHLPKDLHITDFRSFTTDQLLSLLDEIKFTVCVRNSGKMNLRAIRQGLVALESALIAFTPLKVQGLSNIADDPDFQDTCKELMLDNMDLFYTDPKYRIAYSILTAMMNLHIMNSRLKPTEIKKPEPQRNSCDKRNDNEKKEEVIIDLSKPVTGNAKILELSQALEI